MKILGCPHLWIIWLITQGVILLYLLTAYTVSIASRPFCQVKEMLEAPEVIRRKQDDHHASHSNGGNQFFASTELEPLYLLLHPRVLRSHHSDVLGSGCAFRASVWPCDFGAAMSCQREIAAGLQHAQQNAYRARLCAHPIDSHSRSPGPELGDFWLDDRINHLLRLFPLSVRLFKRLVL